MKTIRERIENEALAEINSSEYSSNYEESSYDAGYIHGLDYGFKAGAKFGLSLAFEWMNIDGEEPIEGVTLILKENEGGVSSYMVGWYLYHNIRGYGFYTYPEPDIEFLNTNVVAYRYINQEDMR